MMKFITECRRRRVFRVVGLYIVGAWVVLQVTALAFESWGVPSEALRVVWLGIILGIPLVLILGWRFDIVGGRLIRTADSDSSVDLSLRSADYLVLAALTLVMIAAIYGVGVEISAVRTGGTDRLDVVSVDPKSIAILPFTDASADSESAAFLAVGIQDDLLSRLSKIAALKVISRTSTERYRNSAVSTREIGNDLGVSKILEGGVQRAGDKIRINVQLIDAGSDQHIWAATYDRILSAENIFSIQSEIVETIVQELKATLTPQESLQLAEMPTRSLEAYTAYLKGLNQAGIESVNSLNAAIGHFKAAIGLDADFALAYVGLADAYLTLAANFYGGLKTDESNALAEPALMRALELDRTLGQAYATLGFLRRQQGNPEAAEEAFRQAISFQPNYPRVFRLFGQLRWAQGRQDEAIELLHKALALDPFSAAVIFDIARRDDISGRFDEALAGYLRVINIEPDHAFAYVYIAAIYYLVYGQADESLVWYHRAAQNDALSPSLQAAQSVAYLEIGDPDSAKVWIDKALKLGPETFWAVWSSLLLNYYQGKDEAAQRDARTLLEIFPGNWGGLKLLRNADLAAGRPEVARSRYARAYPELTEPEKPNVNRSNYQVAVDLALVLQRVGEQQRADDLLRESLTVLGTLNRLGTDGFWITDVSIYALQQRPQRAIAALRVAIDEGWRVLTWFYLDYDPNLDSIRDTPEFRVLRREIEADLAIQAERARNLQASGEL